MSSHSSCHNNRSESNQEKGVLESTCFCSLPKVLLLGDSVRMSYQSRVADMLAGEAVVDGPEENGQFSFFTLANLARWVDEFGKPDIVHWNNGIHDAGHNPDRRPSQVPVDLYKAALDLTLERLKRITPCIIWATITPIHPDKPFSYWEWSWQHGDIEYYNDIALELMERNHVQVNDLHRVVAADVDEYLCEDKIHLSEAGKEACAQAVVLSLKNHLPG